MINKVLYHPFVYIFLRDVEKYRHEREISIVRGQNIPNPITNFEEANMPGKLLIVISRNF